MVSPTAEYLAELPSIAEPATSRGIARSPWLVAASFVLLAYAIMGKGAGYIGVPPVFVGELLLFGFCAWETMLDDQVCRGTFAHARGIKPMRLGESSRRAIVLRASPAATLDRQPQIV